VVILINTAIHRGEPGRSITANRFNGFFAAWRETVKTVAGFWPGRFHRDQSRC